MLTIAAAALSLAAALPLGPAPHPPRPAPDARLIELSAGHAVWLLPDEITRLAAGRVGFMDVTDRHAPRPAKAAALPTELSQQSLVEELNALIDMDGFYWPSLEHLQSYENRFYESATGLESAMWVYEEFVRIANGRSDVSVNVFEHSWLQPSIVVRVQGQLNETVIFGGHVDTYNNLRSPGADDDGSGTVQVMEAFRVLMASGARLSRSVEFHVYAAEERGLLGSGDVADHYGANGAEVVAYMNADMTGYVKDVNDPYIAIITDQTSAELNQLLRDMIDAYLDIPWRNGRCNYACSDHAPWNRNGFAASFPFEQLFNEVSPFIHTSNDLVENMNRDHPYQFAKLANAFIAELAA